MRLTVYSLFYALFFMLLLGCSSADKINTNTAEGSYALAQKYEKDERYEEAINLYTDVKNKYPYSSLAVDSELKIGDVEYERENFVEAETAYKLFKEFHPDHSRMDYVTFRLGASVYKQLPATIDRDLSLATSAIDHFENLISNYPKSPHIAEAKDLLNKTKKMLADKTNYIAEFYFIREKWESSLGRYEDLLRNHPNTGYEAKALLRAAVSAYKLKDVDKAKTYFKRLLAEYPESTELAAARKEFADGF